MMLRSTVEMQTLLSCGRARKAQLVRPCYLLGFQSPCQRGTLILLV